MSKWTPDEHGCIYDEAGCFARLTPNKAERLAFRHNADIDALTAERDALARRINTDGAPVDVAALCLEIDEATAERDELQRRLGAVVAKISEAVVSDDDCVCSMLCHSAILAIAEGREASDLPTDSSLQPPA